MADDVRLEVRSEPRLLAAIRGMVRAWVKQHGVDPELAGRVVLALDEACSNAMRHAYGGRCDEFVELVLRSTPAYLEFVLRDRGVSCPKEKRIRREMVPPDVDSLCPGGLGIQLMYEVFDEVEFQAGEEGGNCVTLRLNRTTKESS